MTDVRNDRPPWSRVDLTRRLADWYRSPDFTIAEQEAHRAHAEALVADWDRWDREARWVRSYTASLPAAPDPKATAYVDTMLRGENAGLVRWSDRDRDWYIPRPPPIRREEHTPLGADQLLGRLEKVRPVGPGRWQARCPAHRDRRPSLSIRRGHSFWLLKCWAGCDWYDVVAGLGLQPADLAL